MHGVNDVLKTPFQICCFQCATIAVWVVFLFNTHRFWKREWQTPRKGVRSGHSIPILVTSADFDIFVENYAALPNFKGFPRDSSPLSYASSSKKQNNRILQPVGKPNWHFFRGPPQKHRQEKKLTCCFVDLRLISRAFKTWMKYPMNFIPQELQWKKKRLQSKCGIKKCITPKISAIGLLIQRIRRIENPPLFATAVADHVPSKRTQHFSPN